MRDKGEGEQYRKLVEVLNGGGIAVIPTDTVYGLIGKAFDKKVFKRLDRIKGDRKLPYTLIFASLDHLESWYGHLNPFQRRVTRALLPGPVTLILPPNNKISTGYRHGSHGVGVRVPSDELTPKLCKLLSWQPLWATSANRSGESAPITYSEIDPALLEEVDISIDSGKTVYGTESTVIDLRRLPFTIKRHGSLQESLERTFLSALALAPLKVLIVCRGNICRSPMAEILLRSISGNPIRSGISVTSAGIDAVEDLPASDHMLKIADNWGIDLSGHLSRRLTGEMLLESDIILLADQRYYTDVIELAVEAKNRIQLLGEPLGLEAIPDPYRKSYGTYREIASIIHQSVNAWKRKFDRYISEVGWRSFQPETPEGAIHERAG
ncbi:Sua5/YciO/YrdC/YwlC family protein [bacterium]|nr:Sua5/YciO/YrdC/YwlC family protein [bacterium]